MNLRQETTTRINHVLWTLWIVLRTLRLLLLPLWTLLSTLWTMLRSVWTLLWTLWTLWTLLRTIWKLLRRLLVLSAPHLQPNRFVTSFLDHTMVKLTPSSYKPQLIY
ncbi:uncharacterized protein Dere_GG26720 [Drosophila erecta]|nr:uncharacterized protein Dere_GG26720 [Drosophila erecta]